MFILGGGVAATYSGYRLYNIAKSPDFQFLNENKALIADLAEAIIPRTNTPGAKDVKAEEVIITLIKNVADKKTQNNFIEGLKDTDQYSQNQYQKAFTSLTAPEQIKVLEHFAGKGRNFSGLLGKAKNKFLGKSFFDILKSYTTVAYCTSRQGATETLAYDYVPGRYEACIPLSPRQRSWATK